MTNEELTAAIQAGAEDKLADLWQQIDGLVKWKAKRVIAALDGRCGVEFDDLYQSGYLAMLEAVKSHSLEKGSFSAWFMFHLKTAFAEATGYRTKAGRNDPINTAVSLSMPLSNDGDGDELGDLIPDKRAAATLEAVEERAFQEQLRSALEDVLAEVPGDQREVLRLRYWDNMTLEAAGEQKGIGGNQVRQLEDKAIRALRKPKNANRLRPFYDFNYYSGSSLGAFRSNGMSVQERYLVYDEKRRKRAT